LISASRASGRRDQKKRLHNSLQDVDSLITR
jgi:hypothetical protein